MLIFKKTQETIEKFDGWSHFLVRQLIANQDITSISDFKIIEEVIKSKFHYWRGEEESEGQNIDMSSLGKHGEKKTWTLLNNKFYGFFDNSKIVVEDYKKISHEDFKTKLFSKIKEWNEDGETALRKVISIINNTIKPSFVIYHLDLDENKNHNKVAEWHVYSVFIGFLAIDKVRQTVTLIEFGQD